MEFTLWVEQRDSGEVGGNVRGELATISKNEELINSSAQPLKRQQAQNLRRRRYQFIEHGLNAGFPVPDKTRARRALAQSATSPPEQPAAAVRPAET